MEQLLRESHTSFSTLLTALIYLCRLKITQQEKLKRGLYVPRITLCGRRMFLCALVSSHKYLQDKSYSSIAWSKLKTCSSLRPIDITRMELDFLNTFHHDLFVHGNLFEAWMFLVHRLVQTTVPSQNFDTHSLLSGNKDQSQSMFTNPLTIKNQHDGSHLDYPSPVSQLGMNDHSPTLSPDPIS